jgi:hypothetical protein
MGWASGSDLARHLIRSIKKHVSNTASRKAVYHDLIVGFEDHDCDTLDEAKGEDPLFDKVLKARYKDSE